MRNARRRSRSHPSRRPRLGVDTSVGPRLAQLRQRFAKFRREHPPQTRIPDTLRGAALAAVRHGVTPAEIRRACGLTSKQLELWQQSRAKISTDTEPAAPRARVFDVVDEIPGHDDRVGEAAADQQLELRVGGWLICVRPLGR